MHINVRSLAAAALAVAAFASPGCAYEHDPNSFFPADFATTYTKVKGCTTGTAHSPLHYQVYVSPGASVRWLGGTTFQTDDVMLRVQYADEDCTIPSTCTAMKKLENGAEPAGGDWNYQIIETNGDVRLTGQWQDCIDCHKSCAPDYSCANN